MNQTKTRRPGTNKTDIPRLAKAECLAAIRKERNRTLSILATFLHAEGVPNRDKDLVRAIYDRIAGRDIIDVLHDVEPVIQHPAAKPGRKPSIA